HLSLHSFPTRRSSDLSSPISESVIAGLARSVRALLICSNPRFGSPVLCLTHSCGCIFAVAARTGASTTTYHARDLGRGRFFLTLDRKSTRLNSSHVSI